MEADEIENYSLGSLSDEETARIDEHLLLCESCQQKVAESDAHVLAMQEASLRVRQEARVPATRRRFFHGMIPVMATAAVLVLAAIAIIRSPVSSQGALAFAVNLAATRGAGIEATAPAGRPLVLNLETAGLPAQPSYRVEIVDEMGKTVWTGSAPAHDGHASTAVPQIPLGVHFVRLYSESGALLREYGLTVGQ